MGMDEPRLKALLPPVEMIDLTSDAVCGAAASSSAGPSSSRAAALPDTSGDEEFARKLFVLLNHRALGICGDGALVDLVSDDDEEDAAGNSPTPGDDASRRSPSD